MLLNVDLYAQSAETGSPFNQYMSADAGVNPLSGTVSVSKNLASLSAGDVQASFAMSYSGNVTQSVNNRNDVSPTGWLGLGWAMGFAKIICEHNNSMSLDDDSYYLLTAEGNRHKIVKQKLQNGQDKWWITNLPYWKIEPEIVKGVHYGNFTYDFIVGWVVTDDSGRKYRYGDFLSKNDMESLGRNDFQNGKLLGNATQYVLCWPDTYGMVGENLGGTPRLYPNVWNLQKMEDLKGNYLSYTYMQKREALAFKGTPSIAKYTKECYLQKVESSEGERVEFILKPKGEGAFVDEFLDLLGNSEVDENDADGFVDPVERHYLEKVVFYGKNGNLVSTVEFCYEALSFAPKTSFSFVHLNVKKDSRYVKRILKSVIFTNSSNQVFDRESYEYNTDKSSSLAENNAPFGMMTAIQGPNCGRVEFKYTYQMTSQAGGTLLHSQVINLKNVSSIGYLEDGTPYIAGINPSGYVSVYVRAFGKWYEAESFNNDDDMKNSDHASFMIGDKGWFIYVKELSADRNRYKYTPIVWNGKKFEKMKSVDDGGVRENVTLGAGFLLKSRIDDGSPRSHITLTIPWTSWGASYVAEDFVDKDGNVDNGFAAEDGYFDRQLIKVYASTNHVGLFYLGTDGGNNGRLKIYTFNHDKTKLVSTYYDDDLDDDNTYVFSGNMVYGATESRGPLGHNADVFQWYEPNGGKNEAYWENTHWDLDGVQSEPSIQAYGADYFVVKHDDGDDMSLFYWDGESWSTPYKNQDMVDGDTWDFFYESEWDGCSGNNFFIAREPLQVQYYITFSIPYPTFWKIKKKKIKIPVWTSTNRGALLDRYELRDGVWRNTGAQNLDNSRRKTSVMVGTDWYIDRTSNKALTWDGVKWNMESFTGSDVNWTDDYKSLGGNFFVVESGNASTIYFKKSDSFKKDFGFYIVTKKIIEDPVLDKVVSYEYDYVDKDMYGRDKDVSFDFVNNTPVIAGYMVKMNGIGVQDKILCKFNSKENLGLGAGQICEEITKIPASKGEKDIVTNSKKTVYERYHGDDQDPKWPTFIYQDRIKQVISESNKSKSIVQYGYSKMNGQISSVKTYLDGKEPNNDPSKDHPDKEKRIVYAVEDNDYKDGMKKANRLLEEYETRECLGACGANGKNVVSANVSRYKSENGYYVIRDVWTYTKMDPSSTYSFNKSAVPTNNANWKMSSDYTTYENYKAIQSIDELGIKSSAFYENRVTGLLLGNVVNAGYEESFLLPGTAVDDSKENVEHSLNFRNYQYWIVPFVCGNATDWYNSHENNSCGKGGTVNPNYDHRDDPSYYGRFASNAILVDPARGKNLRGSVKTEKDKRYVFSAWVQGTNIAPGKATLLVDDVPVKEWDLQGNGKWQPVEWDGMLTKNTHSFELKPKDAYSMHVQNVLFIPSDASATITYWNRQWNKPVVTVNDRGIGSYSVLDDNGRVIQTFGEDNDGNLVKLSETEYRVSDCRANPVGTGNLAELRINGNVIHGIKNGSTMRYVVPNNTDEIDVSWMTEQKNDRVQYAFIKKGDQVKPQDWKSSCCGVLQDATLSMKDFMNWYLLIDVLPFEGNYYTIEIAKATTGWIDHGGPLSVGRNPVFASSSTPNRLLYLPKNGVAASKFEGNVWSEHKGNLDVNQDLLRADAYGNESYVLTLPYVARESWTEKDGNGQKIVKFNNTTAFVCKPEYGRDFDQGACSSNLGSAGERYGLYHFAVGHDKKPYVLYQQSLNAVTKEDVETVTIKIDEDDKGVSRKKIVKTGSVGKHLIVKKYEGNSWKTVGNTLRLDTEGQRTVLEQNIVSDGEVIDADMIFGNDGLPYVAYIGVVDAYKQEAPINEVVLDKDGNEKNVDKNISSPNFVVVKRLYQGSEISSVVGESVWAGLSKVSNEDDISSKIPDVNGDILYAKFNDEEVPITTAKRIKLAKGKNGLYLAVLYQLVPKEGTSMDMDVLKNKYALSVFKGTNQVKNVNYENGTVEKDGILFDPILDQSVSASIYSSSVEEEQRIIAYLDDSDPFDIEIYTDDQDNEYPYVMFANESNLNKLTVIKYNGSRWLSVGKPAFADVLNEKESADLAVESGIPYVVYREGALSNNVLRRNHIVPQKYSANGDKDLTLLSLGNVLGTSIASNFRQYILNYGATVASNVSYITIKPVLSNTDDACSIVVENNEKPVAKWKSNEPSCGTDSWLDQLDLIFGGSHNNRTLMDIPLTPGPNTINVKVYDKDNDYLAYNVVVEREIVPEANLSVTGDDGETVLVDEKVTPTTDGTDRREYTYISYGVSKKRTICFQFNAFWTMQYNNRTYHMGSCVDMIFPKTCSDAYFEIVKFSDAKGNLRIYKFKDGSCGENKKNEFITPFLNSSSSGNNPVYNSSSSVSPYLSSSSCGYEGCLVGSSSSIPPYYSSSSDSGNNQSSSSCDYEGCLVGSSSSSDSGNNQSSSSCMNGNGCAGESSSSSKCVAFVNGDGNYGGKCFDSGLQDMETGKCYTMNPDRVNDNPIWISEVASDTWWWVETPCYEQSSFGSSSSNSGNNQSSSSCDYDGCLIESSSSSCDYGCSTLSSSSSVSENIPEEYTSLMQYKVFTTGHLNIADRVVLNGGSYGCASANVGSNANISIMLYATGDVELRNNSYTEQVVAGGSVSVQSGAQYGFLFNEPMNLPNLVVQDVPYGSEDLIVYGGQTVTVQPGMYKRLHVYAGANVTFVGGVYNFESFNIESDAKLSFNNSVTPIRVWVQNTFSLGDRVEVNTAGTAEDLFIYTNTGSLYLGVISSIRAVLVAPNAIANIASRYTWDGQIWAREITIQPDAVVR